MIMIDVMTMAWSIDVVQNSMCTIMPLDVDVGVDVLTCGALPSPTARPGRVLCMHARA